MSYLREAVDKQRSILIHKLIHAGVYHQTDPTIYHKTMTELVYEYERSVINKNHHAV
ncbi:Fur-regulated basic protein FbpA [Sediminibacillus albus]|uniref:Fur-regulated basic protein A n=1 Tax=Sediminibacillus albus TaxID=407036 RepID=A0A1G9A0A6_9BACI|nr:Fur-regulated basic protein FbpA [Sediminibacillus albus]SDK20304.1 Fur-regulated basic protein A [Sediminibacillus albus]